VASCRSCDAPVDWALTEAGRRMPVDAGERPDGNLAVSGHGRMMRARALKDGEQPAEGERRTVSHYATCPDSDKWRDRGRG